MQSRISAALATLLLLACRAEEEPDAYGTFETTEVVVSAEASGRLLQLTAGEGDKLAAGVPVGLVDTTMLVLEREQVEAQRGGAGSRVTEAARHITVLETEYTIAQRTYERLQRLHTQQAATTQQLDQAERDYRGLGERIAAARAQQKTASQDVASSAARVALVADRLRRSQVINPVAGTVLTTYAEAGEFVQPGQPLYKIANLDSMVLRAYVTEPQLAQIGLGRQVQVTFDAGTERRAVPGTVTWIAAEAEFTPTPIQTRDERADLVYAVKIRVANPGGAVKIGLPADVRFAADSAPR